MLSARFWPMTARPTTAMSAVWEGGLDVGMFPTLATGRGSDERRAHRPCGQFPASGTGTGVGLQLTTSLRLARGLAQVVAHADDGSRHDVLEQLPQRLLLRKRCDEAEPELQQVSE